MKKLLGIVVLGSLLFLQTSNVNAHDDLKIGHNKHKPRLCMLEQDRSWLQKMNCRDLKKKHSLCKLDISCALIKLDEQQKIIDDLEKENKEIKDKLNQLEKENKEIKDKLNQ